MQTSAKDNFNLDNTFFSVRIALMKKIFIFPIMLLMVACGTDIGNVDLDMNRPYIEKVIPGDEEVTIVFKGQNAEYGFAGYNVFFSEYADGVISNMLLGTYNQIPTVEASRNSNSYQEFRYTMKNRDSYYRVRKDATSYETNVVSFDNGVLLYFWVASYNDISGKMSSYSSEYRKAGSARPEENNISVSTGDEFSLYGLTPHISISNGGGALFLVPLSGMKGQDRGYVGNDGLSSLVVAPTEGYLELPLRILNGHLYAFVGEQTNYAKIYIQSSTSTTAVIDYCYQISAQLEYY